MGRWPHVQIFRTKRSLLLLSQPQGGSCANMQRTHVRLPPRDEKVGGRCHPLDQPSGGTLAAGRVLCALQDGKAHKRIGGQ